jgi:TonB dependent receptor/TonB-dependent Receptor Plug Domain
MLTGIVGALAAGEATTLRAGDAADAADGTAEVIVTAARDLTTDGAQTASEGTVTQKEMANRPLLRPGDVLESVPGLVVTQHSGDGKANQYFLRGFNLDHGTDFATWVDGVPVNMPTHAHGQGYSDLNFLVPELVEGIDYEKGVYDAQQGDFSAAGAARIRYRSSLDAPFVLLTGGQEGYRRLVAATSMPLAGGELLAGGEYGVTNGPWVLPEAYERGSALLKYTLGNAEHGFALEGMAYDGHWNSTDQIPLRAVREGLITPYGNIDPTDGGRSHRWSVSADAWDRVGDAELHAQGYVLDYHLDLFSDFTYFTDPLHGDQFEQYDNRHVYGAQLSFSVPLGGGDGLGIFSSGVQLRDDHIDPVALYDTTARVRWKTVSLTQARVASVALYASQELRLARWWRVRLGGRLDDYHFDVDANLPANSGTASASLASPKLTMTFGPWARTEYFLDAGGGFHSNDARGTTISVDPSDLQPVSRVTPLARARGAEAGLRTTPVPQLRLSASLWTLSLDSELVLDDDASAIVPSGATQRYGVEVSADWQPLEGVRVDADLAWTHARYSEPQPQGQYLPNAPERVLGVGVEVNRPYGWFGGMHLRYFGATPLTQDDSVRSRPSLQLDAESGYAFSARLRAWLSIFNLLDRRDYDIEYYYASQLRGESTPVNDLHVHPVEPRSLRASVSWQF